MYDCYRPQRAVDEFVAWGENLADQRMKPEFYPRVDKANVFRDGYVAERSGHAAVYSRGAVPRHVLRLPGRQNLAFLNFVSSRRFNRTPDPWRPRNPPVER